jgi:hypothetical protein
MRAPQNVQKGPLGLSPKIAKKKKHWYSVLCCAVLCWALMVFVEERLRFFNVWVEEFLDFRGVRREVTMLADVLMMRSECLRALC